MKIVIDGIIASGKSTQLNLLEKRGFTVQREPIDEWPLDLYYSDPERWGFLFQMLILQTLKTLPGFVIYERSPLSSKEVFWEIMKKTELEDKVYKTAFLWMGWIPDVYIFIDTPVHIAYSRLKNRKQEGDSSVTYEYLEELNSKYKKMFSEAVTCDKYIIDGCDSEFEINKNICSIIQKYVM